MVMPREIQTVECLLPHARELVFLDSSATLEKVQQLMRAHEVGMVPIVDQGGRKNVAVIRRTRMWELLVAGASCTLEDLREERLPEVSATDGLDDALRKLESVSGLLVKNASGVFDRLISPRIVAKAMQTYASDFSALQVLEQRIRGVLSRVSPSVLAGALPSLKGEASVDRLTFGEYHEAVSRLWSELGLSGLDRSTTLEWIAGAAKFRNAVTHFRADPIREGGLAIVRQLTNVLPERR